MLKLSSGTKERELKLKHFFLCSHWNRTLIRNLKHDIIRNLNVSICTKDCVLYQKRKLNNSYVIFRNSKQYKKRKQEEQQHKTVS